MNFRQTLKFITLSIVLAVLYSFVASFIFVFAGAFFTKFGVSVMALASVKVILDVLVVVPAIATAARVAYKKDPIPKSVVIRLASLTASVSFILSSLVFFSPEKVPGVTIFMIFVESVLICCSTAFFVKRYSTG